VCSLCSQKNAKKVSEISTQGVLTHWIQKEPSNSDAQSEDETADVESISTETITLQLRQTARSLNDVGVQTDEINEDCFCIGNKR